MVKGGRGCDWVLALGERTVPRVVPGRIWVSMSWLHAEDFAALDIDHKPPPLTSFVMEGVRIR